MGMIQVPYGHGMISRIEPAGPSQAYKTYSMRFPLKTHWRQATCEEVDCEAYRCGWVTTVDIGTELGQKQFYFITHDKERSCSMQKSGDTLFKFLFGPGQRCFASGNHRVRLERIPQALVIPGDFRQRTGPVQVHKRIDDWVDDFANHQNRIKTQLERG